MTILQPAPVASASPDPDLVTATQITLSVPPQALASPPPAEQPGAATTKRQGISPRLIGAGVVGLLAILTLLAFWAIRNSGDPGDDRAALNGNEAVVTGGGNGEDTTGDEAADTGG